MACQSATFVLEGIPLGPSGIKMMSKLFCALLQHERLSYLLVVHYDNIDVYTCLCEKARFTLCNLANVQYAYELVGRDLN